LRVIAAIGEPAVEPVFRGSLPRTPRGGKARIPWAGHALTCYLKAKAVPFLALKLGEGEVDERRVASWALWSIIRYQGTGRHDPATMARQLRDAIADDPEKYVVDYAGGALGSLKDVRALPVLVELLEDAHPLVRSMAARALGGMKEKARPHLDAMVPLLGDDDEDVRKEAYGVVTRVCGADEAAGTILESVSDRTLGLEEGRAVVLALHWSRTPEAIPFMLRVLGGGDRQSRHMAASYLSHQSDERAVEVLFEALHDENEKVRLHAVKGMGRWKVDRSYERVLEIAKSDAYDLASAKAVTALGHIGDPRAVPFLVQVLGTSGSPRYGLNTYSRLAAEALARIGTREAYDALYGGLFRDVSRRACIEGWLLRADEDHIDAFIARHSGRPAGNETASRILGGFLKENEVLPLTPDETGRRKIAEFLASVPDLETLTSDARRLHLRDPAEDGGYTIWRDRIARVLFAQKPVGFCDTVRMTTVHYVKTKGEWRRVGAHPSR
jgi:HEAT repeat protein